MIHPSKIINLLSGEELAVWRNYHDTEQTTKAIIKARQACLVMACVVRVLGLL